LVCHLLENFATLSNLDLVSLGLDESDTNKASLEVYKEHFEVPFIAATEKYYKTESDAFLAENTVSDYLKKAEERLREEEDRIERYLNANTRKIVRLRMA
jgi:cullin 1